MARIKSVGVLSLANLHAIVMAVWGLAHGILTALIGPRFLFWGMGHWLAFGLASVIVTPIVFAVCGWVAGAVIAVVVNFGLGIIKGLEVDIQQT